MKEPDDARNRLGSGKGGVGVWVDVDGIGLIFILGLAAIVVLVPILWLGRRIWFGYFGGI
jgi:hypothetical protein